MGPRVRMTRRKRERTRTRVNRMILKMLTWKRHLKPHQLVNQQLTRERRPRDLLMNSLLLLTRRTRKTRRDPVVTKRVIKIKDPSSDSAYSQKIPSLFQTIISKN